MQISETVSMILFLNSRNDFLWPVIVVNSVQLRTIPVGIALFKDPYHIEYGPLMAAKVISTGPMLIAYFFSQKYVIKGIGLSGWNPWAKKRPEIIPASESPKK